MPSILGLIRHNTIRIKPPIEVFCSRSSCSMHFVSCGGTFDHFTRRPIVKDYQSEVQRLVVVVGSQFISGDKGVTEIVTLLELTRSGSFRSLSGSAK